MTWRAYPGAPQRPLDAGYVLTVDNLLKMLSIQLRLKFNLPAIIMGETGCGKSSLIRNLCRIIDADLETLNIHGGMDDPMILEWTQAKLDDAKRRPLQRKVIFFDEVNTCNSMGLFKEIVCDRCMNGIPIPDNVKLIAACNPYRLRTTKSLYGGEEMAGLVYEHHGATHGLGENVGTGIKDPLRNLVYRVHLTREHDRLHLRLRGPELGDGEDLHRGHAPQAARGRGARGGDRSHRGRRPGACCQHQQ